MQVCEEKNYVDWNLKLKNAVAEGKNDKSSVSVTKCLKRQEWKRNGSTRRKTLVFKDTHPEKTDSGAYIALLAGGRGEFEYH